MKDVHLTILCLFLSLLLANVFSKQRHNKLWRSHSDSDLSEAHEPLCKTPRSLDRSDPHNNGPPSIQQMLGIAVIESLTNPPSATGNTHTKLDESKLAHEDPVLPPRPRQRAATVVPVYNMVRNSRLNLAVSEPAARCHPPPSLHVLSPEEGEGNTTSDLCAQSSHYVPEPKTDCVELSPNTPDQNDSYQVSQNLELCLESAVSKDEGNLPSPSTPEADSPSGAPAAPGLDSSDDNNNPNTADLGTADDFVDAGVSCLSRDSIDFFSAREKFLCLSQDSRPRSFSETSAVSPPQSGCTPPLDDTSEEADEVRVGHHFRDHCTSWFVMLKDKWLNTNGNDSFINPTVNYKGSMGKGHQYNTAFCWSNLELHLQWPFTQRWNFVIVYSPSCPSKPFVFLLLCSTEVSQNLGFQLKCQFSETLCED